jgi:hypothetical protein
MKHELKYAAIVFLLTISLISARSCYGIKKYNLELELIIPGSFTSNHANQCKPTCATQKNGGQGFEIGVSNIISVGYIRLINSFGNPGWVYYIEPTKMELNLKWVRGSIAMWIMEIYGYKKYTEDDNGLIKEEDIVVRPPPWPKFQLSFNPYRFLVATGGIRNTKFKSLNSLITKNCWFNWNQIRFPGVTIDWYTVSYNFKF